MRQPSSARTRNLGDTTADMIGDMRVQAELDLVSPPGPGHPNAPHRREPSPATTTLSPTIVAHTLITLAHSHIHTPCNMRPNALSSSSVVSSSLSMWRETTACSSAPNATPDAPCHTARMRGPNTLSHTLTRRTRVQGRWGKGQEAGQRHQKKKGGNNLSRPSHERTGSSRSRGLCRHSRANAP